MLHKKTVPVKKLLFYNKKAAFLCKKTVFLRKKTAFLQLYNYEDSSWNIKTAKDRRQG